MGYLREVVLSGAFLVAIGEFTGSFCTTLAPLVVTQGVIVGLGSGAFFLSAIAIVPTYFPREKQGFAMGVAAAGSSLGGVVYPIVFSRLQPQIGFAWAVRTISLIALITSLIPCLCIRRRVRPLECRAIFDWTVFKDPKFNLWSVAFFFGSMGIYVPFFLIQQYAARVAGFEPATAFWTLIIMNAASTSGRILPGKVADKIDDPLRVIAVSTAASTVLAFCWIAIRAATPAVFVFSALYGFWSGAFVSLSTPATVSLAPSVEGIGTRLGMFNFIGSLGLLIGNPVAGAITEVSWLGMQLFCGIVSAVAFVLIAVTWLISRRK
jgi:predicted MFS family arabinose efflux permease